MKKLPLIGLSAMIFLVGCVFGALTSRFIVQPVLATEQGGVSYEIQLQHLDGTPLWNFDWGDFSKGEAKQLDCQLAYLGNFPAKITWNTTNLPLGWSMDIWDNSHPKPRLWRNGTTVTLVPARILQITIVLKENAALPNQQESFTLNIISMATGQRIRLG